MDIHRWPSSAHGRSRIVAFGNLVWTVANATQATADFETQVRQSLDMLESHLIAAGSSRTHLLSLQVMLTDIENRAAFDAQWLQWIGANPAHWPQRACFQASLATGLLIELVATAAQASAAQAPLIF